MRCGSLLPNFIKSFDKQKSEIRADTRIEIAVRGVKLTVIAIFLNVLFNLLNIIPQEIIGAFAAFLLGFLTVFGVGWTGLISN